MKKSSLSRLSGLSTEKLWQFEAQSIMLDFRLDPIVAYIEESQEMINRNSDELKQKIKAWEEKYKNEHEVPDAYDYYEFDIINHNKFPELLYNSIYLVIYSVFEQHLKSICSMLGNYLGSRLSVGDIKSSGGLVSQCRKYMVKVIGLNLNNTNDQWNFIKNYQLIRNAIVHNNSELKEPSVQFKRFIESTSGILYLESSFLIFIEDAEFLKSFIDSIKTYFQKINQSINQLQP